MIVSYLKNKRLRVGICLMVFTAACSQGVKNVDNALPYYNTPDFMPLWLTEREAAEKEIHAIPEFLFIDQLGDTVTGDEFKGKIYVADFFFTSCPGICPRLTNNLKMVADTFKNEANVMFLSHSVTPLKDSVPKLRLYAENYEIDPKQWHLVTGDKAEIYRIARQSYFAEEEPGFNRDSSELLHTEHFLLIDKNKHIRGLYNGTLELEAQRLVDDIRILLKE